VDNAVVNAITRAQQEWASKTEPSEPTSLVLDRQVRGPSSLHPPPPLFLSLFLCLTPFSHPPLQSEREEWAKDREKPRCPLCTASFSLLFRRHHCRLCGILACANCSTKRLSIANAAAGEGPRPDRVCDVCFNVTCRRILEAPAASPRSADGGPTNPDDAVFPVDSEGADPRELQAARDRAELGLSGAERGKKEVDDAIARIKAGGKGGTAGPLEMKQGGVVGTCACPFPPRTRLFSVKLTPTSFPPSSCVVCYSLSEAGQGRGG
jgi:hypothetical protein